MNDPILEGAIYEGLSADLICLQNKPTFAELFLMLRGFENPSFPVERKRFQDVAQLRFDQVDDYWGIRNESDIGTDVIVWLFPLIDELEAYHDPGPFTGVRLNYNILRNPVGNIEFFTNAIVTLARVLNAKSVCRTRKIVLGNPPDLSLIESDAQKIIKYWRDRDIEPGLAKALKINY